MALITTSMTGNDKIFETRNNDSFSINRETQRFVTSRSHLPEELHETESVTMLLRDAHANNVGSSSNQSSISFKNNCSVNIEKTGALIR